jgi:hypothetical protein
MTGRVAPRTISLVITAMDAGQELREQIIACVLAGVELAEIERYVIEPATVDEEEKASLWLLAWSCADVDPATVSSLQRRSPSVRADR